MNLPDQKEAKRIFLAAFSSFDGELKIKSMIGIDAFSISWEELSDADLPTVFHTVECERRRGKWHVSAFVDGIGFEPQPIDLKAMTEALEAL